ncbi:acyl carrier protein [Kibdelosporangium philippinense]|uniref:Acyl carrier protein n=1 Tax=Kibdelosporangium philippinense TaxID=211113 RepID=A0ABS8Z5S3_9PSEU|nr:acyl carrier protein [Kibdelosporangium philippinense]MCE7003248.1 acyl carrier protein [Kibdelosporangium philippinense]
MTIDDLRGLLASCAGEDEVPGDISDITFEELGYDSLALIETAAALKRDRGVVIPDDLVTEAQTPSELLELINDRIARLPG